MADASLPPTYGTCNTCDFWVEIADLTRNRCARHAPVALVDSTDGELMSVWPKTYGADGCGEWVEG